MFGGQETNYKKQSKQLEIKRRGTKQTVALGHCRIFAYFSSYYLSKGVEITLEVSVIK